MYCTKRHVPGSPKQNMFLNMVSTRMCCRCILFNENPVNHKICQIAIRRPEMSPLIEALSQFRRELEADGGSVSDTRNFGKMFKG